MVALAAGVVDVPLTPLSQSSSDTMGPLGRLKHLIDGQIKKYEPHYTGTSGVVPAKVKVSPRDAFVSLPSTARSVVDGSGTSPLWTPPQLLGDLGDQLVSIVGGVPRVFNGNAWSLYGNTRTLTNKLSQDVFHTSQRTIQAPDSAWLAGVTCSVWTETVNVATGALTTSYVAFKADNGAWIVTPTVLFASSDVTIRTMAKTVTDGTYFYVFFNNATHMVIRVYRTTGAFIGTQNFALPTSTITPGPWDVTKAVSAGGYTILYAQPVAAGSNAGMLFVGVGCDGTTVSTQGSTDNTVLGDAGVAFLTNDTGNGLAYLATASGSGTGAIWAYEISNLTVTHFFSTGITTGDGSDPDSLAGWVTNAGSAGYIVNISYTHLPQATVALHGPVFDPALRYIKTFQTSRTNSTAILRITQSVAQVSRAFAINGDYYTLGYYQSGGGNTIVTKKQAVTIFSGDYMIGAALQPIAVRAGDFTEGSPIATNSAGQSSGIGAVSCFCTPGQSSLGISAGDSVTATTAFGLGNGIPDGTLVLKWSMQNLTGGNMNGTRFNCVGPSIAAVNGTFDVIADGGSAGGFHTFYTPQYTIQQVAAVASGTFTATGTRSATGMTAFEVTDLSATITPDVAGFYYNGNIIVSGGATSGTNGTFPIARIRVGGQLYTSATGPGTPFTLAVLPFNPASTTIWVVTTTQTTNNDVFTASVAPSSPNLWSLAAGDFDSSYIGADLVVISDGQIPGNVNTYPITSAPNLQTLVTGGSTTILPQIFALPLPAISIQLTTQQAYTFNLQDVVLDYTYLGAIVVVQGAANPANNGTYQITQILTNGPGTFTTVPLNGLANQVNEAFTSAQTVTIFFAPITGQQYQPTWYLVPLSGTQPIAGRFEYGLAYADWRVEGDPTVGPNLFPFDVASPVQTSAGWQIVLPYRAQNVTAGVTQATVAGQVNLVQEVFSSTVGLKAFTIGNASGQSYANSGELLIPGTMATVFTPSGFLEDNVNLGFEQPFLVGQSVGPSAALGLTLGATYFVVAVAEYSDEDGNRIFSVPSPALQVQMSGANNIATYGGRLLFPLGTGGAPVSATYGTTTRQVTISLYRTAWINGVPTTQRFKITDDLNVNGLAPVSATNASGFSFPDSFTWQYIDTNPDNGLNANEILYTDKSFLPRFPAPAFVGGVGSWKNREWVIGYDGAIWMSGEKTEGDAIWFNPAFRYVLPTNDKPKAMAAMEDYLLIFCAKSIWYIPAAQFPDATGSNGALPTPVQLPFQNGSANGFACTIRDGAAYDSTAGGVWMITRSLDNVWLGEPVQDSLTGAVTGLVVDEDQRLFVQQAGSNVVCVYDRVPQAWYEWRSPTQGLLLATYLGQTAYQDTATVNVVTPGGTADIIAGVTTGIAPDLTLAPFNFANVRGVKRVWEFQVVGSYLGPHNLNVVLSYPEDEEPPTLYAPFTPLPGEPYIAPFNPLQEEAAEFGVRIYVDFAGISVPGLSAAFEMISAQVGVDQTIGIKKRPQALTMTAKT